MNWYGLKEVRTIWNCSWNDPQIEYKKEPIDEWYAKQYIGEKFECEMKENKISIPDTDWEEMFEEWVQKNEDYVYSLLDDILLEANEI